MTSTQPAAADARPIAPLTYTGFGLRLFQAAAGAERGNLFVSPVSAGLALAMAFNAAAGQARTRMAWVLGLGELPPDAVNEASRALMEALADAGVELSIANSLWVRSGHVLDPAFVARARESFAAHVATADFDSADAVAEINRWVSEATRGHIPRIAAQLKPDVFALLLNAVYFKGRWTAPFDPAHTRDLPFHTRGRGVIQHPAMRRRGHFGHVAAEGFAVLRLPYGDDGRFALYALLPDSGVALGDVVLGLTAERLAEVFARVDDVEVRVTFPRFKLRGTLDLEAPLSTLGMGAAFQPGLHAFSNLYPPEAPLVDVWIDQALQQTFVEVNEEGTEAAALTEVAMAGRGLSVPQPVEFNVDRPFLALIRDDRTGALLFIGQVADPSAGEA